MSGAGTSDPLSPPSDAVLVVADAGELRSWQPRADVTVSRVSGVMTLSLSHGFESFYVPIFAQGRKVRIFVDLKDLHLYTRAARERMTSFALQHVGQIEIIHVYLRSKLVALGVSAFKHAADGLVVRSYTDRSSFLLSYEAALAGRPAAAPLSR
jgi:hypothetical protein